jgi:hypothetical protein
MTETENSDPAWRWTWERALRERSADGGLSPTAQHIALMMATHADPAGDGIRPTVLTLCRATGRGRSVVSAGLKELRDSGWITQIYKGSQTAGRASVYRLSIPASG